MHKHRNNHTMPTRAVPDFDPATTNPAPVAIMTKADRLLALLSNGDSATIAALCEAAGWQAHSIRGALAGSLRRKGHVITSEKHEGIHRYRIRTSP